jgi:hypothetical protein
MSDDLDLATVFLIGGVGGDVMATSVLKSYRNTISRLPDPSHPLGPLTTAHTIFQVPAGKTWLVINLLWRAIEYNKLASSIQLHKTRGDSSDPIIVYYGKTTPAQVPPSLPTEAGNMSKYVQNLVFDNEEMFRQVVEGPNDIILVMQYEMSVLEMTPV